MLVWTNSIVRWKHLWKHCLDQHKWRTSSFQEAIQAVTPEEESVCGIAIPLLCELAQGQRENRAQLGGTGTNIIRWCFTSICTARIWLRCNCFLLLLYCRTCVWGAAERIVRHWWFLRGVGRWDKEAKYHRPLWGKHENHTSELRSSSFPTPKCWLHRNIMIDQNHEDTAEHHQQKETNMTHNFLASESHFLLLFREVCLLQGFLQRNSYFRQSFS